MRLIALMLLVVLAGCTTGHDFASPTSENLVLGRTSRSEILRLYGAPFKQSMAVLSTPSAARPNATDFDRSPASGSFNTLVYFYQDRSGNAFGAGPKNKFLFLDFWNDNLVAYNFTSSFAADSSNFDESKIVSMKKGVTTRADVTALLGIPTGRAIYPFVRRQGIDKFIYTYLDVRHRERVVKRLEVLFDSNSNKVIDYRFGEDTTPIVPPPRPAPTFLPIILPHK